MAIQACLKTHRYANTLFYVYLCLGGACKIPKMKKMA